MSTYAWVIDKDHLAEPAEEPGTYQNAVGLMGPRDITPEQVSELEWPSTAGAKFKIYDDDGELYYEGRFLGDSEAEEAFGPLEDFGDPNAGATEIRYRRGNKWETL